ncbi:SDR family oxidoreductase [Erythrobacter sp. SCSIO 43205]|uniref:SDR family oxidoreductase n=1 Tax=Erythrobacter sp. SCSIO 43205 TaxID=2779361 RepID=UPI001CA93A54|nr:SDR family oxidoreductase [Erythrobacter sp. SCSIO 43205]UAB77108.1 SDR family oxidoreductase [Erythrobacter sp. SCSIO 43205]
MPQLNRRNLLAGAAATGVLAASVSVRASDLVASDVDLTGKSILITGCSSGFGRLAAEDFARKGAKVFATMRNLPRPEADELMALAAEEELDLHVIEIDVLSDEMVVQGVARAEEINGGGIDILVNNAGIGLSSPVEVQDMAATQLIFDTNVFGCHRMARAVLPGMRTKGSGQIFQISSQLGRVIVPNAGHYSATKFALEAMSEQLAYELVPHNIDVTIIEPGGYPTKVWVNRNILTRELKARADEVHTSGYPQAVARMGEEDGSGRTADPMDVPNAMAQIIAMPPGTRPLRREVHPGAKPQIAINKVSAEVQVGWLGQSGYGPWIKAVHNV